METFTGVAHRVVAASSMDVYRACGVLHRTEPGPPEPVPLTEESPFRTQPPYSAETIRAVRAFYPWVDEHYDKVAVERVVMSRTQLPGTMLRLPMVYGPGDPAHRLFPILKRIDDGRPAILLDEAVAQWRGARAYVEDVAEAIALAAANERAAGRVYNVADSEAFTELDWTRKVAAAAGWGGEVAVLPSAISPAHLQYPGDTRQHWVADSTRIRRELGYSERAPIEEALERTIAWERAHPPAQVDPRQFDYVAEDAALASLGPLKRPPF
jgi:nucleoside-diphosphate-sugar epimerase